MTSTSIRADHRRLPRSPREWLRAPLFSTAGGPPLGLRLLLLASWIALVAWLASVHVVWRDEARAFSFATSGASIAEMWHGLRGEGHPALWYLVLRAGHALTGTRDVLAAAGLLFGIAAAALFALRAPLRIGVIAIVLFGSYFVMDYTVIARNYGLSVLIIFAIAAGWSRIRNSPWLGLLLFLLANVNVPSVVIAGALFLHRALEVAEHRREAAAGEWRMLALNAVLAAAGALTCFLTVYPPFNDAAVGLDKRPINAWNVVRGLFHTNSFVRDLDFGKPTQIPVLILLAGSLLMFARHRRALLVAVLALVALKYFHFFIYTAYLRHIALILIFLLALLWIVREEEAGSAAGGMRKAVLAGQWMFIILLSAQVVNLVRKPIVTTIRGTPYSQSANLARLLDRPDLRNAILMADPDMVAEPIVYHRGQPFWLLRQSRFDRWSAYTKEGRSRLTLDDIVADARLLNGRSGRPVVIVLARPLDDDGDHREMFHNRTLYTPEGRAQFLAATRPLASLRPAQSDEEYDVYLYPSSRTADAR